MSKFTLQHLGVEIYGFLSKTANKDLPPSKNAEQRPDDFCHFVGHGPLAGEDVNGNHLLVQLKANQAKLFDVVRVIADNAGPAETAFARNTGRSRQEDRTVEVFPVGEPLPAPPEPAEHGVAP
jgi:hypothetical protein